MSNFVATDVYALFNIYVEKSASDLAEDGFPKGGRASACMRGLNLWYIPSGVHPAVGVQNRLLDPTVCLSKISAYRYFVIQH